MSRKRTGHYASLAKRQAMVTANLLAGGPKTEIVHKVTRPKIFPPYGTSRCGVSISTVKFRYRDEGEDNYSTWTFGNTPGVGSVHDELVSCMACVEAKPREARHGRQR